MSEFLEIFKFSFIIRAILGGIFIGFIASLIGNFVLIKKSAFFADAVSHSALSGIALALLLNLKTLPFSLIFALLVASLVFFFEKKSKLDISSIVGILLSFFMASGVLILNFIKGYKPDLMSFLFGNILAITSSDLKIAIVLSLVLLLLLFLFYKKIFLVFIDRDEAKISGLRTEIYEYVFYLLLASVVILSVYMVGIILATGLLVIPAASSRNFSGSVKQMFLISSILGVLIPPSGVVLAYFLSLPASATIIALHSFIFLLSLFRRS